MKVISNELLAEARKSGYSIVIDEDTMFQKLLIDLLNYDVPYFTHSENKLYLGDKSGTVIGEIQSNEL